MNLWRTSWCAPITLFSSSQSVDGTWITIWIHKKSGIRKRWHRGWQSCEFPRLRINKVWHIFWKFFFRMSSIDVDPSINKVSTVLIHKLVALLIRFVCNYHTKCLRFFNECNFNADAALHSSTIPRLFLLSCKCKPFNLHSVHTNPFLEKTYHLVKPHRLQAHISD